MERRLAAILAADMVGYSRLMAADEAGTIERQKAHQRSLIDPKIADYGGRMVKTTGDGLLVEFPSVVDAVQCAVEIQRSMPEREAAVPDAKRIRYRIGINLGDIVIDDEDILGDGVNIAARLESLSEPEGLCISDVVYQNVQGKLDLSFEDLGEQALKNMERKVRAWRWADAVGHTPHKPKEAPSSLPLPDKPSIAVLPFTNMSGDPEQEYFAAGIVEEIITALSKISELFVVARNSTFTYKGQAVDVKRVGREQGVQYVLEGSVRKAGSRLRVTTQLIDAVSGHHLWAERYDREASDVFAVQDDITREVASALQVQLTEGEQARLWASGTRNLQAWEFAIRASDLIDRHHWEDTHEARRLLEQALRLDEDYAAAWSMLGATHWTDAINAGWSDSREESLALALEANDRAQTIDPTSPGMLAHRALIQQSLQSYDEALALSQKAVMFAPNNSHVTALAAVIASYGGEPQNAIELVERAIRLCPIYPAWYLVPLCRAYWVMERFEDAIDVARSAIERNPNLSYAHVLLAIVYADMGRENEAQRVAADVLRVEPKFTISAWAKGRGYNSALVAREAAALRKAGLPG
jgi:adenylate cyclase